jgi:anti-sigma regulatory factor (Ser/Thr protein kinase)
VGDVTDKGVPAALVMATTRSMLRAAVEHFSSPGEILAYVNNLLCPDIPPNMFVTCLYMIIDPASGRLRFANAGHNLPIQLTGSGVQELRATGMPLGLLPEMSYEEQEAQLAPGQSLVLYSDGLVEAHSIEGNMFGFPRLRELLAQRSIAGVCSGEEIITTLIENLRSFTGEEWEQEDDVTMVTLVNLPQGPGDNPSGGNQSEGWKILTEFTLPSEPGNELQAMEAVIRVVEGLGLSKDRMERLKTAVAETTMNAIEHGNQYREDLSVGIQVLSSPTAVKVRISDHGGGRPIPDPEMPDLDAKLAGLQSPRGWGLFLIKNMVDDMNVETDETHHTVELIFNLEGSRP